MSEIPNVFGASVLPYPTDLPLDEIRTVIAIVTSKAFVERKEELAKSLWIIVGYGLGKIVKDPSVPGAPMALTLSDEEALEVLKTLELSANPGATMGFQIPEALIAWAVKLLLDYLKG